MSKSTCEPSTAAARIARGDFVGAPLSVLRRLAGKAGRFAANFGTDGVPPGILKPLTSHGFTAAVSSSLCSRIHAFAAGTSSSRVATSWSTTPFAWAAEGLRC